MLPLIVLSLTIAINPTLAHSVAEEDRNILMGLYGYDLEDVICRHNHVIASECEACNKLGVMVKTECCRLEILYLSENYKCFLSTS